MPAFAESKPLLYLATELGFMRGRFVLLEELVHQVAQKLRRAAIASFSGRRKLSFQSFIEPKGKGDLLIRAETVLFCRISPIICNDIYNQGRTMTNKPMIGYAKVSADDQNWTNQHAELHAADYTHTFAEKISAARTKRPGAWRQLCLPALPNSSAPELSTAPGTAARRPKREARNPATAST